jgi:hypothetical protein
VVAGCGPGPAASGPSASPDYPPASAVTSTAAGSPLVLARQAYLGMWQAFVAASRTADYQSPQLDHYAAGQALTLLVRGLYQSSMEGIVTCGEPAFDPVVTITSTSAGEPAQARVIDCADSASWLDYYKSGKPAPGAPPGRQRVYASLETFYGTWKVTTLVVEKEGTCA